MAKSFNSSRKQPVTSAGARGRTARTRKTTVDSPLIANKAALKLEKRTEVARPTGNAGGGKNRGDRRDMSKTYSGTKKHASRGNDVRPDVKTRKR